MSPNLALILLSRLFPSVWFFSIQHFFLKKCSFSFRTLFCFLCLFHSFVCLFQFRISPLSIIIIIIIIVVVVVVIVIMQISVASFLIVSFALVLPATLTVQVLKPCPSPLLSLAHCYLST